MSIFHFNYWDNRYRSGGNSGKGSTGRERAWKWEIIDRYMPNLQSVIDFGCGDLRFWFGRKCKDYTGIDVSETILKKNKSSHPEWEFIRSSSDDFIHNLKKETVLCLDLLFHIMNEDTFVDTLYNVCCCSSCYIFIHTWKSNPFSRIGSLRRFLKGPSLLSLKYIFFPAKTDMKYQYFRSLADYLDIFKKHGFQLLGEHKNPYNEGCMYVFKKKG